MVLDKIKNMISSNKESKELEQFTARQRERIFDKISRKEDSILRAREEKFVDERIQRLEKKLGLNDGPQLSGRKKFREQRLANLERQKERTKKFFENEKKFREGKLAIKPVGPKPKVLQKKLDSKLKLKEIKLRAPRNGI